MRSWSILAPALVLSACGIVHVETCDGAIGACPAEIDASERSDAGDACVPGRMEACGCGADLGARACNDLGRWDACRCEHDAGAPCTLGATRECTCGSYPELGHGTETCGADTSWGECEDCICGYESCNGVDDDCDRAVDEGHVCPDDAVGRTSPFEGRVYVAGRSAAGTLHVLVPIYPARGEAFVTPIVRPGEIVRWSFAASGELYAWTDRGDVTQVAPTSAAGPSSPCVSTSSTSVFVPGMPDAFFCGDGDYVVGSTRVRASTPVSPIYAAFRFGDTVLGVSALGPTVHDVMTGLETSHVDLTDWPTSTGVWSASVGGDALYAATVRCLPDSFHVACESLVLRVERSSWSVVRRVPGVRTAQAPLPLSDGSLVTLGYEEPGGLFGIQAWIDRPGAARAPLFREIDELDFASDASTALVAGP